MNTRIKEALEAGKAIHCKTEDEARRLFDVMGWKKDDAHEWLPYPCTCYGADSKDYVFGAHSVFEELGREVVPFFTLTRSRLAEVLGVEENKTFTWRGNKYEVYEGRLIGCTCRAPELELEQMIAYPEEIRQYPAWSVASAEAARAAELLGFTEVNRDSGGELLLCHANDEVIVSGKQDLFPELQPRKTVPLSEIIHRERR